MGEKALKEYKENPWILRRQSDRDTAKIEMAEIQVGLKLRLNDFDKINQNLLVFGLAAFLNISPEDITITGFWEGSVIVIICMPKESAEKLGKAYAADDIELRQYLNPLCCYSLEMPLDSELRKVAERLLRSLNQSFEVEQLCNEARQHVGKNIRCENEVHFLHIMATVMRRIIRAREVKSRQHGSPVIVPFFQEEERPNVSPSNEIFNRALFIIRGKDGEIQSKDSHDPDFHPSKG